MRFQAVFYLSFLAIALGVFQSAAGEPSAPTNANSTSPNTVDDFDTLVKRGDRARLGRDYIAAIKAYRDALALRDDTLIEAHVGLMLFELREFHIAALYLQHAVEKPAKSITDADYARLSSAFRTAQKEVCRIDIEVDRRGTRLEIDGEFIQEGKGEFWFFVAPGKHKLRVSLEGFEDEIQEIDAPKGDQKRLKFMMRPIAKPPSEPEKKPPQTDPLAPKKKEPIHVPEYKPTAKTNTKSRGQFVVGGGLALVLGATPNPALGPQVFGAWRSRSWWEIGLDGRVGWMVSEDKRFPNTGFITWSAGIVPCGRLRDRFFGCALLQVDGLARTNSPRGSILPAFGVRGGIDLAANEHVRFQGWVEAALHPRSFSWGNNTEWHGFPLTGSVGVRAVYVF